MPIDFNHVYKKTGISNGVLCKSKAFGWGVYNRDNSGPNFAEYDRPRKYKGLSVQSARIVDGDVRITIGAA